MKGQTKKAEQVESILQLGEKAFRELFPIVPTEWLQLDLTMPQLKIILLLFLNGPSRMSAIASALDVSLATATGIVDRLVERDIVVRQDDPDDRRVVLCSLSDRGQKLIGGLWALARARARQLLEALERPQLSLITEALEALLQAGEASRDEVRHE